MTKKNNSSPAHAGDNIQARKAGWSFGGKVPARFDEHIRRSVPWYETGHEIVLGISDHLVPVGGLIYDIGCSTGTLSAKLARRHSGRDVRVIGIEREAAMLNKARQLRHPGLSFKKMDASALRLQTCHLGVLYYVLQFVDPARKTGVLKAIHDRLVPGGGLLLFEKVLGSGPRQQEILGDLYTEFKLDAGYTPDEILAKSRSLKGILQLQTSGQIEKQLKAVGFKKVECVMRYLCFSGWLALR